MTVLLQDLIVNNAGLLTLLAIWTIPWKGVALWRAAKRDNKIWFVVILIINTLAILDILYIFVFSRKGNNLASQESQK